MSVKMDSKAIWDLFLVHFFVVVALLFSLVETHALYSLLSSSPPLLPYVAFKLYIWIETLKVMEGLGRPALCTTLRCVLFFPFLHTAFLHLWFTLLSIDPIVCVPGGRPPPTCRCHLLESEWSVGGRFFEAPSGHVSLPPLVPENQSENKCLCDGRRQSISNEEERERQEPKWKKLERKLGKEKVKVAVKRLRFKDREREILREMTEFSSKHWPLNPIKITTFGF